MENQHVMLHCLAEVTVKKFRNNGFILTQCKGHTGRKWISAGNSTWVKSLQNLCKQAFCAVFWWMQSHAVLIYKQADNIFSENGVIRHVYWWPPYSEKVAMLYIVSGHGIISPYSTED